MSDTEVEQRGRELHGVTWNGAAGGVPLAMEAVASAAELDRIVGRQHEQRSIDLLIRGGAGGTGGALVLRGEIGVGRSALLASAAHMATAAGLRVLRVAGAEVEQHVELAGLYSLLRPVLDEVGPGRGTQSEVLVEVCRTVGSSPRQPFVIGVAVLEVLVELAGTGSILLIVDDAQWLDESTLHVLTFVARRLASVPIALLAATTGSPAEDRPVFDGLPELRLTGLDESAAGEMLEDRAPELSTLQRSMVVAQALGNPLALSELSANVRARCGGPMPTPVEIPIGGRLMRSASARLTSLSDTTRQLLLLVACDDRPRRAEVLAAAEVMGHAASAADDALVRAVDAGVVVTDGLMVQFVQPVVRAAVYQGADGPSRREAHTAMSMVVASGTSGEAWHTALSIDRPDRRVASKLASVGGIAVDEGRMTDALLAHERAAWLTDDRRARSTYLLAAAESAWELGAPEYARGLVALAGEAAADGAERVVLADPSRRMIGDEVGHRSEVSDLLGHDPGSSSARRCLVRVTGESAIVTMDDTSRASIVASVRALGLSDDDPLAQAATRVAGPEHGSTVPRFQPRVVPEAIRCADLAFATGAAASSKCEWSAARQLLVHSANRFRAQQRLAMLAQALTLGSWAGIGTSEFKAAELEAEEATRLAAATEQPLWRVRALAAQAQVAAIAGDDRAAGAFVDAAERLVIRHPSSVASGDLLLVRGHIALTQGRSPDAMRILAKLFDDRLQASVAQRLAGLVDFVEASAGAGDLSAARRVVGALGEQAGLELRAEIMVARAIVAPVCRAEALFADALESDELSPFLRARVHLSLGTFLRRARRVVDSREPLEIAATAFDTLGAPRWAARANEELRATGIQRRRGHASRVELSERELVVAQMAASGLSNRQIAQRLIVSSRTVSAQLYRIFPKLGVTSRGELREALAATADPVVA